MRARGRENIYIIYILAHHGTVQSMSLSEATYRLVRYARRATARRHCARSTHDFDARVCA
eukprot:361912-Pleurochrysis_carterae.AAC.1